MYFVSERRKFVMQKFDTPSDTPYRNVRGRASERCALAIYKMRAKALVAAPPISG
jgi:hypothetical protein